MVDRRTEKFNQEAKGKPVYGGAEGAESLIEKPRPFFGWGVEIHCELKRTRETRVWWSTTEGKMSMNKQNGDEI